MSNEIIFDIPADGIKNDDNILIELSKHCDIESAKGIFDAFQKIYPEATITMLHPDSIKSIRFFHKAGDNNPILPF